MGNPADDNSFLEIHPWVGKIPWRRKQQPTPVFLPGEFHGPGSLVDCSPWDCKESDTRLSTQHTHCAFGTFKALQYPEVKRSDQPTQTQNLPSVFDHGARPKYPVLNLTNVHREPPVSQALPWFRRTQLRVWQRWAPLPPGGRLRTNSCDAECLTGFISSSGLLQEIGLTVPS